MDANGIVCRACEFVNNPALPCCDLCDVPLPQSTATTEWGTSTATASQACRQNLHALVADLDVLVQRLPKYLVQNLAKYREAPAAPPPDALQRPVKRHRASDLNVVKPTTEQKKSQHSSTPRTVGGAIWPDGRKGRQLQGSRPSSSSSNQGNSVTHSTASKRHTEVAVGDAGAPQTITFSRAKGEGDTLVQYYEDVRLLRVSEKDALGALLHMFCCTGVQLDTWAALKRVAMQEIEAALGKLERDHINTGTLIEVAVR